MISNGICLIYKPWDMGKSGTRWALGGQGPPKAQGGPNNNNNNNIPIKFNF